jgi:DNA polymerase I-like protein with 3'-5' exonuclease and polymerase domains
VTFVALDNKEWCKGIYHNGKLHFDSIPSDISKTWKYASYLNNKDILYASLYAQGKSIDEVCPEYIKDKWEKKKKKLKAFHTSFQQAKIPLDQVCFYDLVPQQFLLEICDIRCQIIDSVFETTKKPSNYNLLLEIEKILLSISSKPLNLDLSFLQEKISDNRARLLSSKIKKTNKIEYNLFGSRTGRLTTKPNTFPILNLDSKFRSVIKPTNDIFIELDYNAAEIRVLLGLSEREQPQEDIHSWNAKRLSMAREDVKKEIFAWLYGSSKIDSSKYENLFRVNKIVEQYYDGKVITNPYGRKIESDSFHKMNYLVQSTSADLVLEQIVKINQILSSTKSHISFIVHDSVVIDLAKEDRGLVDNIIATFSKTRFGNFPVNISVGKDYGSLRKI